MAELKKTQDELEVTQEEEKDRYLILKEIELEQSELFERYKNEKKVQSEEYQRRLDILLGKKEG